MQCSSKHGLCAQLTGGPSPFYIYIYIYIYIYLCSVAVCNASVLN